MMLLSDGSDLVGIESVLDIKYIRLLRLTLRMITAWPYKEVGEPQSRYMILYRLYIFTFEFFWILPGMIYVKLGAGKLSFFELGHTYITVMMNLVTVTRLVMIFQKKYHNVSGKFIKEIHLFNHKDRSPYAMETHLLVHKMSHFFTLYLNLLMVLGIIMFNALPFYNNVASGAFSFSRPENVTFEPSVYYALPFDYRSNFRGYLIIASFNMYLSFLVSTCFCGFDLYLSLMIFHIWGHLRILMDRMNNFPRPKNRDVDNEIEWYSEEERIQVYLNLRKIMQHHNLILDFISQMTSTFGAQLFVYYGFHQAAGCLLLLECSQMDLKSLLRYGPLTLIIFQQLITISMVFEFLGATTDKLIDAAYNLPWECMDNGNRKIVHVLMKECQKPLTLKAVGMVDVGCQTMIAILKTSFSYFIMLQTVASNE